MYRGVLYVQMDNLDLARQDHATLKEMNHPLAEELAWVIDNKKEKRRSIFRRNQSYRRG